MINGLLRWAQKTEQASNAPLTPMAIWRRRRGIKFPVSYQLLTCWACWVGTVHIFYSSGTLSVIPEPATLPLLALGTLLAWRRR